MSLSRTVSAINSDFHKNSKFSHPRAFNAPAEGVPLGISYRLKESKKLEQWGYQMVEKVLR